MLDSFKSPTETAVTKKINTSRYPTSTNRMESLPLVFQGENYLFRIEMINEVIRWGIKWLKNHSRHHLQSLEIFFKLNSLYFPFHKMSPNSFFERMADLTKAVAIMWWTRGIPYSRSQMRPHRLMMCTLSSYSIMTQRPRARCSSKSEKPIT